MAEWLKILMPSTAGVITAVVVSFFSARWGARRAFQERWWDRKLLAYSEIIDALHDVVRYCDLWLTEYYAGRFLSEREHPKAKEFGDRYTEAYWKIQKATDIGAFVICHKAAEVLTDLRNRPRLDPDENPSTEIYEDDKAAYTNALRRIREYAQRDLKI